MTFKEKLRGCLVCGAIGDAVGSKYEGTNSNSDVDFNFHWSISDDTQLTLATCEAIYKDNKPSPEKIAAKFLEWFNKRKLSGLGSSTLKALTELQVGGHWALVGRSGEYAAGNGAAMRIAPIAFKSRVDKQTIKDICIITHKNDEAYVGALAIYYSVVNSINGHWTGANDLIEKIINDLPDTKVKDRLIELDGLRELSISEIANKCKPTGYVVDSVPFSIFAAQKINQLRIEEIFTELIKAGGDTDTVCSMTGQILGSLMGLEKIPKAWLKQYYNLDIDPLIAKIVDQWDE